MSPSTLTQTFKKLFASRSPSAPDDPIRAELFSIERLEQYAAFLADSQGVKARRSRGRELLPRVIDNKRVLNNVYRDITMDIRKDKTMTPATEWLIDNFFVIEEQIAEILKDLPPGFYRELPKLINGPLEGYPRVYGVAWSFVAHTDSRFDPDWLRRYVKAYQTVENLCIGEVWALAISLRIVLIENLRRLADRITQGKLARHEANQVADAVLGLHGRPRVAAVIALYRFENAPLHAAFAVQLVQRLRDQGAAVAPVMEWLDDRLASQGTTAEDIVRAEHQAQSAMNATIRNVITSMRFLSSMDWSQFVEDVGTVDQILREGSNFSSVDFSTRDLYRHAIEELARGSGLSESEVARRVLRTAAQARKSAEGAGASAIQIERRSDPGYYLISKGRASFEKEIDCHAPIRSQVLRLCMNNATLTYLGSLVFVNGFVLTAALRGSLRLGMPHSWIVLFCFLGFIPASDIALAIVNRLVMRCLNPQTLPKLDFSDGVPSNFSTLVVVPTLLTNPAAIQEYMEHLEVHYLANAEGPVQFALLTDWTDAAQERTPADDVLLDSAVEGIHRLNLRYGPGPGNSIRFLIFHRRRIWDAQEGVWMGWERKRGKLRELNQLLRGAANTTFIPEITPITPLLESVRYVVTLDTDTRTARGAIYHLVGAMAHPLNRAHFSIDAGRVVEGYGILQPRITPVLPTGGSGSIFQRVFSGPAGIDPYAFAVSDVYQDLFQEGSYVGKGIYDLDAFEASLDSRVPENRMLSHDLFEGVYARTALVTDIEFFEEFPPHYETAVARSHRWARGDWQLLPWIIQDRSLPFISRWKIIDNLRRSLSPIIALVTLACAWTIPSVPSAFWTGFILLALGLPPFLSVLTDLLPRRGPFYLSDRLRTFRDDLRLAFLHFVLSLVFLAHQSWVMIDAISRTLFRLFVSHRQLLEWTSAAQAKMAADLNLRQCINRMAGALLIALAAGLAVLLSGRSCFLPLLLISGWMISPWAARQISLPKNSRRQRSLTKDETNYLRTLARQTWRFFETFVNASTNFLPPDNFQEAPHSAVARRTSPTNIGLYLLSIVAARDFGWLGLGETVDLLEATMGTLKKLPRYRGHLFNWYDIIDLRPLDPLYVSTVDSGNLAGHLITLASACREMKKARLLPRDFFLGLNDTLRIIGNLVPNVQDDRRTEAVTGVQLEEAVFSLKASLDILPISPSEWPVTLDSLQIHAEILADIARALAGGQKSDEKQELLIWSELLLHQVKSQKHDLSQKMDVSPQLGRRLDSLAQQADDTVRAMEFQFLLDPIKKILSIGLRVAEKKCDTSYYDLLASEARLASFIAIAKGDIPATHWFHLGRSLTSLHHGMALLSWSGSMFEYLMPLLIMRSPAGSLLDQTYRNIVQRQIDYGDERRIPWGISESGYNTRDIEMTYQYSNFGVPGLGLKRGLSEDLVISPYATCLAAMVDPVSAVRNLHRLAAAGAGSIYGFYEALDYTPERLPENEKVAVVRTTMAHHQGMSLLSLNDVLYDAAMRRRFHLDLSVQATELLLQERAPRDVSVARPSIEEAHGVVDVQDHIPSIVRRFRSPHQASPHTHLLSNGRYSVMITTAGSGYSRWRDLAVTRWREDTTRDPWGTYIFLRDVQSGIVWSAGYQPTGVEPDDYEVDFSEERAEIVRRDGSLITTLEVIVSPEDDAEIRRVTLRNIGGSERSIEITSYAEMVLAPPTADNLHPAFSNLFVQTEFVPEVNSLLCSRRARQTSDNPIWAAHLIVVKGEVQSAVQYESDRAHFLGRGRAIRTPLCMMDGKPLTNTTGAVLDPIVSLRQRLKIGPGESVQVSFVTLVTSSREQALILADKYHDPAMFERTATLAWTQAQVQQHYLGIDPHEAHLFQSLASRILYADALLRPGPDVLERNARGAGGLWAHGISGDIPIVLVRIDEVEDRDIIRQLLRAYEYWNMKNLAIDLVIVNERLPSYIQELQTSLEDLVQATQTSFRQTSQKSPGRIFLLRGDRLTAEDKLLLQTAARLVFLSRHGSLSEQAGRAERPDEDATPLQPKLFSRPGATKTLPETATLEFYNGLGGFAKEGHEYVTILGLNQWTPAPWLNVISNPEFGFQVTESGMGYTWSINSSENQLTPWSNDPVSDPCGEAFYVRDMESGDAWTPTALPIREEAGPYIARHGQGYSIFEHASRGINLELIQFVPSKDPIKISRLTIENRSARPRKLSATAYLEWVLGVSKSASAPFIVSELDSQTGALFARNAWNSEFSGRVAFADLGGLQTSWTADRTEFLGRHGTHDHPAAIEQGRPLSGKVGAGLDPCAALQTTVTVQPGERVKIVFFLGQSANREEAVSLLRRYRAENLDAILSDVNKQWEEVLETVQIRTPQRSLDILVNRWLLYQTLTCRIWARAAFYQAGGAYGFRDQLQDVMAITISRRDLARQHILRAAGRQFPEGDVQHWWHPPAGRGLRTHISDDLLWLPYAVSHYLEVTGDTAILEESVPFLESQAIPDGKEDAYFQPQPSLQQATLFEHCARALDKSLAVGLHGLPLMGTGDWNDGMNRIGPEGKGESVWLAWFLHANLWEFARIADKRGESARAERWRLHVSDLKASIEKNGWDGNWYRRAYFDDGTPVGSAANPECRIDSIAQSWGVLSGAADPSRALRAMGAVEEHLVNRAEGLILLLTPPFDKTPHNPGYIKGYLPGVRENGGQYTHAAVWAVLAFAALGDGKKAVDLFNLLNPIHRGNSRAAIHRYKVEPYVAAGDVYSEPPHAGRGGWTWYTGSAGWMYRAAMEWILGIRLRGSTLLIDPCIPPAWPGYEVTFRYHSSIYEIKVDNLQSVSRGIHHATMDGKPIRGESPILLVDDGATHNILIALGRARTEQDGTGSGNAPRLIAGPAASQ